MQVPDGLGVRIPGFHPGGPGSIPGLGVFLLDYIPFNYRWVLVYRDLDRKNVEFSRLWLNY